MISCLATLFWLFYGDYSVHPIQISMSIVYDTTRSVPCFPTFPHIIAPIYRETCELSTATHVDCVDVLRSVAMLFIRLLTHLNDLVLSRASHPDSLNNSGVALLMVDTTCTSSSVLYFFPLVRPIIYPTMTTEHRS
jgi:hypothetical protein